MKQYLSLLQQLFLALVRIMVLGAQHLWEGSWTPGGESES